MPVKALLLLVAGSPGSWPSVIVVTLPSEPAVILVPLALLLSTMAQPEPGFRYRMVSTAAPGTRSPTVLPMAGIFVAVPLGSTGVQLEVSQS